LVHSGVRGHESRDAECYSHGLRLAHHAQSQGVFEFAAAHRLPTTYEFDFVVRDGGLMSYAPDLEEIFGRVAALVDRILKGAKRAELPFEQPTHFKLVINLKTAKALGLEVPTACSPPPTK
jgi:ABC-type uncharacterized transport system substrate-binding protein